MLKPPTVKQANCRYGTISYYESDRYIGYALKRYGEYSEAEVQLYRRLIAPGDTVVEVGANIGALTLALADIVGVEGDVLAFEPQPENYDLLQLNVLDNDAVTTFMIGVGAESGEAEIPALAEIANHNYGGVALGAGQRRAPVRRLDDLAADFSFKPSFIKIDVEGMEAAVLRGAAETIKQLRPVLYVENDRADKADELTRLLAEMNYKMFAHHPPIFANAQNFNGAEIAAEDAKLVSLNLLCIPSERRRDYESVTADLVPVYAPRPKGKSWVCIVRVGGIGDNLVAASVLRPLHRRGYKIEVISQEPQSVLFENNPFIDKLAVRKHGDLPTDFKQWGDYYRLRAVEYDKLVNLSHSMEGMLALVDGAMAWDWPAAFRRKLCGHSYLETAHDIVGVPHEFGSLFFPTEDEIDQAHATMRKVSMNGAMRVVGWCLAGSRLDKVYPAAPLAIARLLKEEQVAVIMFGAKDRIDFEMAETVHNHVKANNSTDANLHLALSPGGTDTWPIRRAITTAMHCSLIITPDTGMGWGVAMEPVPKIMLHSHASQINITKHWLNTISMIPTAACWPCHKLHNTKQSCEAEQAACGVKVDPDAKGAACITSIPVENVLEATRKALAGVQQWMP